MRSTLNRFLRVPYCIVNSKHSVLRQISRPYSSVVIEIYTSCSAAPVLSASRLWLILLPPLLRGEVWLYLIRQTNPTLVVFCPVLCHHALAWEYFPDRKGYDFSRDLTFLIKGFSMFDYAVFSRRRDHRDYASQFSYVCMYSFFLPPSLPSFLPFFHLLVRSFTHFIHSRNRLPQNLVLAQGIP